ncbi:topless-related protein 2 [Medicago truncatula]|uniref:topless-related protein 2 n=1 Tax=Medicago truncatula TaxID=3880 RepID=UPI0019685288|nr:topless-related protein 2 [Medicago truncatula]
MSALYKELLLLVHQYLDEEGLKQTMRMLEKESGVFFDLKYFEEKILAGEFDESEKYLSAFINITDSPSSMKMFFEIRKQKYLEALDRGDKTTAVEILVKDLKIFSTYNNDLYNKIINLITLDNFRENVELSHYRDVKSIRKTLMEELKNMIDMNLVLKKKIMLPSLSSSRLRYLVNQGLNWQHHLCKYPKENPEVTTLLIDHTCPSPQQMLLLQMPTMLPATDSVPLPPAPAWMVNGNPSSSSQSHATLAASSLPGPSNQGSISKLSLTMNAPLPPMDRQSNDRVQQLRRFLAAESVEEHYSNGTSLQAGQVASTVTPQPTTRLFDEIPQTVVWELNQGSTVKTMEFHPTIHSILAVGCENGEISLWDARIKEKLIAKSFNIWNLSKCSVEFQAANPQELSVIRVAWSPDASYIGVAFAKHLIHLYSYQFPKGVHQHLEIDAHDGGVNDLAFSVPKNQLCVVTCGDDKLIKVWDLNGDKIFSFEGHVAPVCSVLPHSKRNIKFLISTSIDGKFRVWLYENESLQVECDTPGKCSTSLLYSADGTRLFSCGTTTEGDCFLAEWDDNVGVVKRIYSGFRSNSAGMVQFDTAKSRYLAVGVDNQIKFWDVDIINVLTSTDVDGGLPSLPRLTFNKEGNLLAVSTVDGGFKVLANVNGIKFLGGIESNKEPIDVKMEDMFAIASSDENNRNSDDTNSNDVKEITLPVQCQVVTMPETVGPSNKAIRLVYTNDGDGLLALGSKGIQKLWKWKPTRLNRSGKATASVAPEHWTPKTDVFLKNDVPDNSDSAIPCLDISNNDFYAMSSCGGIVSLFNMVKFKIMAEFLPPPPAPTFLAFNPVDNNIVVIGREDAEIDIFMHSKLVEKLRGHQKHITGIVFSPRLNTMVTSDADAQLFSWCTTTWVKKKQVSIRMPGGGNAPAGDTKVQFRIDQVKLLVCHETQIAIYDASNMELIRWWLPQGGLSGAISSATYCCHGEVIYAAFTDGNIGIFSADNLILRCRISSSSYLFQTPSNSQNVYPLFITRHPQDRYQFAIGLSDGSVTIMEPKKYEAWWW